MRIIPAIDLIDGKCVRLTQGDYEKKMIDNENPLEVAKMFADAGLKFLHLVDQRQATVGVIGLGYVGLPLAAETARTSSLLHDNHRAVPKSMLRRDAALYRQVSMG